jgi:signal transduction histidine kinase
MDLAGPNMFTITQVNDVPDENTANQLIAVAKAGGCIEAYKFKQPHNGKYTVIVVRQ